MIEVFTPSVVVPPLIVKLLKLVNMVAGKVLLAVIMTEPIPGVQVFPATVLTVIAPPIESVPPAVILIIPAAGVAPAFPSVKLPVINEEPFEKVIVPVLETFPKPPNVEFPDTVIENAPLKLIAPKFALFGLPTCKLPHAAFAPTVTVNPLSIITTSPATGHDPTATTPPPDVADQVVFIAQLPVTRE